MMVAAFMRMCVNNPRFNQRSPAGIYVYVLDGKAHEALARLCHKH